MKLRWSKKLFAVLMAWAMTFSLSVFSVLAEENVPNEGDEVTFQMLFTSDIHGSFEDYNYATATTQTGSMTKQATIIRNLRDNFDGKTYVIDVGDLIQGNGTSMFLGNDDYKPFPAVAALEAIGFDAIVLGNHEFNFGIDTLYHSYDGFSGAKITGNVYQADGSLLDGFAAYDIFEAGNGLRVAVIGTVTPNITRWDAVNLANSGITARSAAAVTRETIDYLIENDLADIFVAAAHLGDTNQYGVEGSGAIDVALLNPELAVILGAHYHTIVGTRDEQHVLPGSEVKFAQNRNAAATVGQVLITATYENGRWVVQNKAADYDTSGVKTDIIRVEADTPKDPVTVAAVAQAHQAAIDYVTKTVVGYLEGGPLVGEAEIKGKPQVYLADNALSDLILNVMLEFTDAQLAGSAPLSRSANAQPGELVVGDIAQIYRFDNNTLYTLEMTGAQFLQWMEWAHNYYTPTINGVTDHSKPAVNLETDLTISIGGNKDYNQDQFAGLDYTVDLTKPVGERITITRMWDGSEFDLEKTYLVASNDYRSSTQLLTTSEDGVFKPGEAHATLIDVDVQGPNGETSMMDLVSAYIAAQPNQTIYNTVDHNWEFINLNWDPEMRAKAVYAINNGFIETDFTAPVTIAMIEALDMDWPEDLTSVSETSDLNTEEPAATEPAEITEPPFPSNEVIESGTESSMYTVVQGDNLYNLAVKFYGDGTLWHKIYEANQSIINNPNLIFIGQELLIPKI